MFRNQYDNDVSIWSPQGRIHQIEYAMEAVKQGSATVGVRSKTHAVLTALKRAPSELSTHQTKIIAVDDHVGVSIAGLTADARLLSKWMQTECLNSKFSYDRAMPVQRLVNDLSYKCQVPTMIAGRRPYGVGFLVIGYDENGPHLFQTCPSSNNFDCKAMSIGSRSQSARTYLERHLNDFTDCDSTELVKHCLRALRDTLPAETELTVKNCSVALVGGDTKFNIFSDVEVGRHLDMIEGEVRAAPLTAAASSEDSSSGAPPGTADGGQAPAAAMDVDAAGEGPDTATEPAPGT